MKKSANPQILYLDRNENLYGPAPACFDALRSLGGRDDAAPHRHTLQHLVLNSTRNPQWRHNGRRVRQVWTHIGHGPGHNDTGQLR